MILGEAESFEHLFVVESIAMRDVTGDGAGVGKGRTIAGIIYENYLLGRKRALWFSVSSDLKFDAERDLRDIGASRVKVIALNKVSKLKRSVARFRLKPHLATLLKGITISHSLF